MLASEKRRNLMVVVAVALAAFLICFAAVISVSIAQIQHKVMDRLICGDVGYGKTEIALRAAFKAVQEGKQVAYLVPTTILA